MYHFEKNPLKSINKGKMQYSVYSTLLFRLLKLIRKAVCAFVCIKISRRIQKVASGEGIGKFEWEGTFFVPFGGLLIFHHGHMVLFKYKKKSLKNNVTIK